MKRVFLINPYACVDPVEKVEALIRESFGDDAQIRYSEKAGHLSELAREYGDGAKCTDTGESCVLYSVGGDGTLFEVVNGAAESQNSVCVIPAGSGNDFSRMLTNEKDYKKLLRASDSFQEHICDCGKAGKRYFANIASVGYDAAVVENAARFKKIPVLRRISYILSVFYTLFTYKGINAKLTVDGKVYERRFLLIAFANGQYYGGGIHIAPTAALDDGFLDVYVIDSMSMFRLFTVLPKLTTGSHAKYKAVHIIRAKTATVECEGEFTLNLDGDLFTESSAVDIKIIENGLKLFY